jgi:hypothetical protein
MKAAVVLIMAKAAAKALLAFLWSVTYLTILATRVPFRYFFLTRDGLGIIGSSKRGFRLLTSFTCI